MAARLWASAAFLGLFTTLLSVGLPTDAFAGEVIITNQWGQKFKIKSWDDGARRDKYSVHDETGRTSQHMWFASNGSANGGRGETGRHTTSQEWCRVRYLYGDDVRIPECWGEFMYSSHLITGLDGNHYELWFSPSSLSYYKIRQVESNTWYAHDGSSNDGRKKTSRADWCRVLLYHAMGIVKIPEACSDQLKTIMTVAAGTASKAEMSAELGHLKGLMTESAGAKISAMVAREAFNPKDVGVGMMVGYGTETVKGALGWGVSEHNKNAGDIAADMLTTTAVNTGLTTMIMTAAGSTFNPVAAGVGLLIAGGAAGGEALYAASEDTGLVLYDDYHKHPRWTRDLNGISLSAADVKLPERPTAPVYYSDFKNPQTGRCWSLDHGKTAVENKLILWDCTNSADQKFGVGLGATSPLRLMKEPAMCLGTNFNRVGNGEAITVQICDGSASQQWTSVKVGDLYARRNGHGKCMSVEGGKTNNGASIIQWDCTNDGAQLFQDIVSARAGEANVSSVRVPYSSKCWSPREGSTSAGTEVLQWDCTGHESQAFVTKAGNGTVKIQAGPSCVGTVDAKNGTAVTLVDCNSSSTHSAWTMASIAGTDRFTLKNAAGKCIAIERDSKDNGARLVQWDCDPSKGVFQFSWGAR